jgi:hypothetical protein
MKRARLLNLWTKWRKDLPHLIPPVQQDESSEALEKSEVKPLPLKEEKKPVKIFDTKSNSFSEELAVPRGSVDFDQKNQLLYKKRKIPRNQR